MMYRINKAMVGVVSFAVVSACLAAAMPKSSTSADSSGNLDGAKVGYRSDDVVQLDVRIAGGGKTSAKSYVITTSFGQESVYKDIKVYNYQTERNEFETQEVGVIITVTPERSDDGMINLGIMVCVVDEPTGKNKKPTFRDHRMDQRLRLSPGKPTVAQDGDLRVTVTPRIISLQNRDSSAAKVTCNSNDVARLDVRIVGGGKTSARSCVITTPFGHEGVYKDTKEYRYKVENNVSETREVGLYVAATPELSVDGVISMNLLITEVVPTRKTTLGQRPFRQISIDQRFRLLPGKPMVVLDGDLRVTVTPRIIPSPNRTPSAAN